MTAIAFRPTAHSAPTAPALAEEECGLCHFLIRPGELRHATGGHVACMVCGEAEGFLFCEEIAA
jgi:hypothetical protein